MIVFTDGSTLETVSITGTLYTTRGKQRPVLRVEVSGPTYAELQDLFTDNTQFAIRSFDIDGSYVDVDHSMYCVAGDIVDRRDGTFFVYLGKKTEDELMIDELEAENAQLLFENLTGGEY